MKSTANGVLESTPGATTHTIEVRLPYDGTLVGQVAETDSAGLDKAVTSARAGAAAMAKLTLYERAELLMRIHDGIKQDAGELARLICVESGKPIREARTEVERSQQTLIDLSSVIDYQYADYAAAALGRA